MSGLAAIIEIRERLELVPYISQDFLRNLLEEIAPIIEDLNIAQLQEGQRADGSSLPDYSETSVKVYGKPRGAIKLFDQGDFYRGITVKLSFNKLEIEGNDSKTAKLQNIYGSNILGLQDSSIDTLRQDYIEPEMISRVTKFILHGERN